MSKKKYTNELIGKVRVIDDFLPNPSELVLKEDITKVTLLLKKESIDYFKKEAKKHHTRYQTMIRSLLDKYVQHYKGT